MDIILLERVEKLGQIGIGHNDTNITRNIAEVLLKEGFIESFEELKNGLQSSLLISLSYSGKERKPTITKIERVSKPGLRVYSGAKKMPRISPPNPPRPLPHQVRHIKPEIIEIPDSSESD